MLDVRRLILLRDLAQLGTVTAVAEVHQVTPSAISQQLRLLEQETGVQLLERTGRSIHLTTAGRRLSEDTEEVLAALERAHVRVRSRDAAPTGPLRVACFPSALLPLAAPLVAAMSEAHPGLELHVIEAEPECASRLLLQRDAELALVYRYDNLATPELPGLLNKRLMTDSFVAVLPAGHPSAALRAPLDLEELAEAHWVTAPAGTACGDAVLQACRAVGYTPKVRHTCADFTTMTALADLGGHVALVPGLAASHMPPTLTTRPLRHGTLSRTIDIALRSGTERDPAITAALRLLQSTAPALLAPVPVNSSSTTGA
ncbi:LysR family transcriptional regulator [Streptacidiphilus rugosus]|uniref:LysR family transcriptional regulator n=1 Tax=Streptacidiphilus rugosus TaxID=405783 RepID=UPI0007C6FAA8|nr:LysR family transcriptional regulator [Streptacidiphilus rugosus]